MAPGDQTEVNHSSENSSSFKQSAFSLELDNYGLHIKVPFIALACLCMCVTGLSLVAFTRTRQTPRSARFLSTALLVFDLLTTVSFTLRKFTSHKKTNILIEFVGIGWSFLAYLNIGIMSFERLVVFQWPNFYLRYVTYTFTKVVAFFTWTLYITSYLIFFLLCVSNDNPREFAICLKKVTSIFIQVTFPTVVLVSSSCYLVILHIIKKQTYRSPPERANTVRMYKSTVVVFLCLVNFILTTSLYLGFSTLTVDINVRRLILDSFTMINGLLDTFLYVLWYKECRMELLKIFSFFFPNLQQNIDNMRVTIFNIVTYDRSSGTSSR